MESSTDTSTNTSETSFSPISLDGNRIQYTKQDVDQFIAKFGKEAPSLLAQDAVMSFATTDYAEQIKKDPNFLTYQGLQDGTATILNYINDPKLKLGEISGNFSERPEVQRKMDDTEILKFFTTLNDVDIKDTIMRELFRSVPSTAAFLKTVKEVGKKTLKSGPPKSLPEAAFKFGAPVFAGLTTSIMTYSLADQIDEMILGAESVTTPGQQRAIKEMVRTGTSASTGFMFPFMIPKNIDWGTKAIIENIADDATVPAGVKLSAGVEKFLKTYSTAYQGSNLRSKGENIRFGALTATGDLAAVGGASVGAYGAEKVDPGSTGTRLLFEVGAGSALPVLAVKASTSISNFVADKFSAFKKSGIDGLRNKAQENQMQKIVDIFKNYEKDPVAAFEALSDPNNIKTFNEVFPEADFSPTLAQESDEILFTIIEAALRKSNSDLDRYAQNSSDKMKTGLSNFLKLMGRIDDEPKEAFGVLSDAAKFRRSAVEYAVGTRVKGAINKLGSSLDLLNAGKKRLPNGKFAEKTIKDINKKISTLLETQINLIRNEEKRLWKGINNNVVISELDAENKPAFMKSWESNKRPNESTNKTQNEELSELFNFVKKYQSLIPEGSSLANILKQSNDNIKGIKAPTAFQILKILPSDDGEFFVRNYRQNYTTTDSNIFKIDLLEKLLEDPKVKLSGKQRETLENAIEYHENAALKILKKEEDSGFTIDNKDESLRFYPVEAGFLTERGYSGVVQQPFKGISVSQLVDIRSKANELARKFGSGPNPNKQYARVASEFASGVLEDLETYAPNATKQYRSALDFSVASNNVITRTIVGKTKLKKQSGQKYISPEYLLSEVMTGKASVIEERANQILNLSDFAVEKGFKGAEKNGMSIRQNMDEFIRAARKELISDTKVPVIGELTETTVPQIDQKKLDAWREKNKELLSIFPNIDKDFATVSDTQRLFSVWDARNAKVSKSIKNTEYLSKMINGQHPITAIEAALKGDQPTRGMLKLFRSFNKGQYSEQAKQAMGEAMINRAFINSGGTGGFVNAKAFYKSFYEPMPDNPSVTMMSLLKSQGIFNTDQVRQIDYISKQLIKLEIAESAGNLIKNGRFNEELLGEVGPLFEFFVTIGGSALGTNVGKTLTGGQPGPGSITMAGKGANFLRNFLIKLPASEKLNLVTELFTNKQLFLNFLKKPKNDREKVQIQKNIMSILTNGVNTVGIDKAVKIAPSVIREAGEDDMTLEDETIEFLERRDQSSVEPSIQTGIPTTQVASRQPFLSGLNTAPAGGGGSSAASAPTDRTKYASLFPNDIISGMIAQQPVTMEYGGEVPNLREAPEVDTLRALTQKELEEASLKYLIDLDKQKKIAMDQFANPFKYLGTGYMDAGSTDAADQYRQEALAKANRLEAEMKRFGMDRAKALSNYSNYLQTDRPVTMRRSEEIEAGNVMVRNFPQELINFAQGGAVPPRNVEIKGQPHMLAYITPQEGGILQLLGGSGKAGPMGIPSFFGPGGPGDDGSNEADPSGEGTESPSSGGDTGYSGSISDAMAASSPTGMSGAGGIGGYGPSVAGSTSMGLEDSIAGMAGVMGGLTSGLSGYENVQGSVNYSPVGKIGFDPFGLRNKMNQHARNSLSRGVQPGFTTDTMGNVTSVTGPGGPSSGLPGIGSLMSMIGTNMGFTTTTGYNQNTNNPDGNGNDDNRPLEEKAPLRPQEIYKTALDMYNQNPNRYTLRTG